METYGFIPVGFNGLISFSDVWTLFEVVEVVDGVVGGGVGVGVEDDAGELLDCVRAVRACVGKVWC